MTIRTCLLTLLCSLSISSWAVEKVEVLDAPKAVSEFRLSSTDGERFTERHLKGRWSFVSIGFTSCPDVCPFVLGNLRSLTRTLQEQRAISADIVFVAVDPERDAAILADYVAHFGDNVTGVTGEQTELKRLVEAIGASYELEKPDASGYYNVRHSAFVALVDPQGRLVARLYPPVSFEQFASRLSGWFDAVSMHAMR